MLGAVGVAIELWFLRGLFPIGSILFVFVGLALAFSFAIFALLGGGLGSSFQLFVLGFQGKVGLRHHDVRRCPCSFSRRILEVGQVVHHVFRNCRKGVQASIRELEIKGL